MSNTDLSETKTDATVSEGTEPEYMTLNIGPSHPATHGTLRIQVVLDGEKIVKTGLEIGYLHRCFEKMAETHPYNMVMPYTDRLNYCSSFLNNVGFAMAVEKLFDVEIPKRAQYIRVILGELSRVMDHCVCIGANLVDLGALTNFWYLYRAREEIYDVLEACCGSRLTVNYGRVGGLAIDVPDDFEKMTRQICKNARNYIEDVNKLITSNRIFMDRTRGVGEVSAEEALQWGYTGPCLRASGVPYDIRKAHPYYDYDKFDWEVPIGTRGDTYDRYYVRMLEMEQSIRIVEQALDGLPGGPVMVDDKRIAPPDKEDVYDNIEGLMHHFKHYMTGIQPPAGEVYSYTEAANGELGYYVISDGGHIPYRVKVRPPCFAIYQSMEELLIGGMVSDVVAILGSMNIIAGELDR